MGGDEIEQPDHSERGGGMMARALDRLFAEGAPYEPNEIVVVIAIVRHLNSKTRQGFPGYGRLSDQTRLSKKTIERVLRRHCDESPAPIIARRFAGSRRSYTFEFVERPELFAIKRDALPKKPSRKSRPGAEKNFKKKKSQAVAEVSPVEAPSQCETQYERCQCGAHLAVVGGVRMNYVDDLPHDCRFSNSGKTESLWSGKTHGLTNTKAGDGAPVMIGAIAPGVIARLR